MVASYRRSNSMLRMPLIGVILKPFTGQRQSEGSVLLRELVLPKGLSFGFCHLDAPKVA